MELKLVDGNYVADATGGLAAVSGTEELAQRVVMKLTAREGGFPNAGLQRQALHAAESQAFPEGAWRRSSTC